MKCLRTALYSLTLVVLLAPSGLTAQAQYERPSGSEGPYQRPRAAVEAISRLKSPYCPGQMLGTCPSGGGAALRDSIETRAEAGWTTDEIVEWVVANYGERYRALPRTEGGDLLAWLVPPAAGLIGVGVLLVALGRIRQRRKERGEPSADDVTEEEERRLREALQALELEEEAPFL